MAPFLKTLFGDARNVLIVALLLALEVVLVRAGLGAEAAFVIPVATLLGIAYLS